MKQTTQNSLVFLRPVDQLKRPLINQNRCAENTGYALIQLREF